MGRRVAPRVRRLPGACAGGHARPDRPLRGAQGVSLSCRFCGAALSHVFADLGMSPLSNAFLRADQLDRMEPFYPLTAYVCGECFLVQLPAVETPEKIF